ncbi:SAM domain-containing protein [Sodiomyces alkalinus F11]|uniref:RNA-binding protein VTS1 n=1 Tax=Sodiomyces alkalinus (strain CBS 110278 / VKM F-3762 / F11) TaxID=1314773 RepID=A0A3N2PWH5_SODAK|nr:SAM domain-containing protein [Sodiomyces alkalinus F11]ROT38861.1 SAM domain-containing protein [Sodiomyces alkalinus F11]
MSGNQVAGNRNSTPEVNTASSLRPPSTRTVGAGHHLRSSADMAALSASSPSSRIRPSSDFYGQQSQDSGNNEGDAQDKLAQQWIADIDQYETTLEEMAAATLDQDFKDELSAIEQWFRVLSEAERTAALYALLQQTTQVQVRFFIQVLQQMGKSHPMSGVLSPANFDKDPMSNRLSDAMSKLNVDSARNSMARPPGTVTTKRYSGLDASTINAMFPDAAAAIASEKAKFTQQTGNPPASNRNSVACEARPAMATPTIAAPTNSHDSGSQSQASAWNTGDNARSRPKSGTGQGQAPMGHFVQPPASSGLRSPQAQISSNSNTKSNILTAGDKPSDLPLLSPYNPSGGNWASMVNTPLVASFNTTAANASASSGNGGKSAGSQADMLANATAMKLAALSTVNNRFALDDVRKYRRARSNEAPGAPGQPAVLGNTPTVRIPGTNVVMINEHGQVLSQEQMLSLQAQQQTVSFSGNRSRPTSPTVPINHGFTHVPFASPQNNGFLSAYDAQGSLLNSGIQSLAVAQLGAGSHEGYLSDHSDMVRGRSRGRRGSSKPPEDPTDPTLLQDIPSWLRSLRLHKYTDNLKDTKWTDLIELDDKALEERGVNALGARRKMLKVFEQVKEARAAGKL